MENPVVSAEEKVNRFFEEVLHEGELAVAFHGYIIHTAEDQAKILTKYQESMRELFSSLSEEEVSPALSHYVKLISLIKNNQKCRLLFCLLEFGVVNNFVNPRLVCELILKCDYLVYLNEDFWCLSFMLIDKIISGIDYKGVRDLLKTMLDKAHTIKPANNVAVMNQLRAVQSVLETIFDRNACLLPSYLILDELQKKVLPKGTYPHWEKALSESFNVSDSTLRRILEKSRSNCRGKSKMWCAGKKKKSRIQDGKYKKALFTSFKEALATNIPINVGLLWHAKLLDIKNRYSLATLLWGKQTKL